MIPTTRISAREIPTLATLVPDHIDRNPWVLYHATTATLSDEIERGGFLACDGTVHAEAIRQLLTIYHSIGWSGVSAGGYAVLAGFSFLRNHSSADRPVFFTAYAHRSPIYAHPDFSGGETAHAIRHAYRDLMAFLKQPALREQHLNRKRDECISLVCSGGLPIRVITADLSWLKAKLEAIEPLFRRLAAMENSGNPGVIYAVEFTPEDLPHLVYQWSNGVSIYRPVLPSRIRHKVEILEPFEISAFADGNRVRRELWRESAEGGLLAELKKHGGRRLSEQEFSNGSAPIRQALFEASGGTDQGMEIALKYGSSGVRMALLKNPLARRPL